MKIKKMSEVFRAVWKYLESAKGEGIFEARWAYPCAFLLVVISLGMARNMIRGIEAANWGYVVVAATAIAMLWINAALFISTHFKKKARAKVIRKEQEEERAIDDLERRMISHNLGDGKGIVLFTPGGGYRALFIVGRDEYMNSQ